MSNPTYQYRTDDGLSRYYTLERLREKTSEGSLNTQTLCTSDEGGTWVSLGNLMEQDTSPNTSDDANSDSTNTSLSHQDDTTSMEQADANNEEPSSSTRKLRRLARTSGNSKFSKLSEDRRQQKATVAAKTVEDFIGITLADGRYKVVNQLGKGSMAYVFRAADNRLETDVVVKIPKPEKLVGDEIRDRFRRESQLLVRLAHPHIVKVLDVGEYEDIPYVVMQLLSGGSLTDKIENESDKSNRMSVDSLKTWVREVGRALDFCAKQGTVHRDVKPANILFDDDNNAYVSDFGLTKIMYGEHTSLNSSETTTGVVLGTPNYIAPEIVLGNAYDGRADQYSMGITVYHTLFGKAPMQGKSATLTMINQTQKRLQLLSDIRKDVPRELALAIRRGIDKDPAKRFDSCTDFAEAIVDSLRSSGSSASSSRSTAPQTRKRKSLSDSGRGSRSSGKKSRPTYQANELDFEAYDDDSDWLESESSLPSKRSGKKKISKKKKKGKGLNLFGQQVHPAMAIAAGIGIVAIAAVIIFRSTIGNVETGATADQIADNEVTAALNDKEETADSDEESSAEKQAEQPDSSEDSPAVQQAVAESTPKPNTPAAPSVAVTANKPSKTDIVSEVTPEPTENAASPTPSTSTPAPPTAATTAKTSVEATSLPADAAPYARGDRVTTGPPTSPVLISGTTVWNKSSRTITASLEGTYDAAALTALSANGVLFAAATHPPGVPGTSVTVWNTQTGKLLFKTNGGDSQFVDAMLLSEKSLFIGSRGSNALSVWDCQTGQQGDSLKINDAVFRHGSIALSNDGMYIAAASGRYMVVLNATDGKLVAPMMPPGQKARFKRVSLKSSRKSSRRPDQESPAAIFRALQALSFSPDNRELAGLSGHPQSRIMCWNNTGDIIVDEASPPNASDMRSPALQWFPNRDAWLVAGRIRDRQTGRILLTSLTGATQQPNVQVYDDNHLIGHLTGTPDKLSIVEVPWKNLNAALQSTQIPERCLLGPETRISIQVNLSPVVPPSTTGYDIIRKAFRGIVVREGLRVSPESRTILQLRIAKTADEKQPLHDRQKPVTLRGTTTKLTPKQETTDCIVAELLLPGQQEPQWRVNLGPADQPQLDAASSSVGKLISEMDNISIPYFIPKDEQLVGLPMVLE